MSRRGPTRKKPRKGRRPRQGNSGATGEQAGERARAEAITAHCHSPAEERQRVVQEWLARPADERVSWLATFVIHRGGYVARENPAERRERQLECDLVVADCLAAAPDGLTLAIEVMVSIDLFRTDPDAMKAIRASAKQYGIRLPRGAG